MVLTGLARTHSPVKSPSQIAQSNLTELLAMTMSADDEDDTQPVMDLDSVSSPPSSSSSSSSSSTTSQSSTTTATLSQDAYQMLRAPAPAVLYPDFIALFAMQGQQQQQQPQQQQQQQQQQPQNLLIYHTYSTYPHLPLLAPLIMSSVVLPPSTF